MQKKMKPRFYQRRTAKLAWARAQEKKNVLVVSPGGSGKTLMLAMVAKMAMQATKTVLVLVHRKELIEQSKRHLIAHGIAPGRIGVLVGAKQDLPPFMSVLIASIQTFTRRDIEVADIVLVDEAHHAPARTYRELLSECARGTVFGFTATPTRLDNVALEGIFDEMVEAAKVSKLIRKGFVARPVCFSSIDGLIPDLADVPIRGRGRNRDYDRSLLARKMDTPDLNGNIVVQYKKTAKKQQSIVFAASILHAQHIADRFNAEGITAEVFHGKLRPAERDLVLGRFKNGQTIILCTVDIANEGLDLPSIRVAIFARPTASFTVYMQQCARVMRPGPQAIILDHAGNVLRHGLPYIDREFTLEGALEEVPEAAQAKMCPECGHLVQCGEMTCDQCEHEFPRPKRKLLLSESNGELVNLSKRAFLRRIKTFANKKGLGSDWVRKVVRQYETVLQASA